MPFEFNKGKRRQKTLIIVFVAVLVITGLVLWFGFLKPANTGSNVIVVTPPRQININSQTLDSQMLKDLEPFEQFPAIKEEEVGRQNPFNNY